MGRENAGEAYDQEASATSTEIVTRNQTRIQTDREASKALVIVTGRQRDIARLDARIDGIDLRISSMDQTGTRGVAVLTARVDELVKDFADLKGEFHALATSIEADMKLVKAGRWQVAASIFFALVPVYAGVVFAIVTH